MIKIRLSRGGKKNNLFFRVVAAEKKTRNQGKPLAILGYWHPTKNLFKVDRKKFSHWLSKGAKATPKVTSLMETNK